jgi:hypothetical protein
MYFLFFRLKKWISVVLRVTGPFLPGTERTRHRPIAVNGRAWARRKFKVGPPVCLSVCHVLVSLPVERTAAVESSSLQSQFIAGPLLAGWPRMAKLRIAPLLSGKS